MDVAELLLDTLRFDQPNAVSLRERWASASKTRGLARLVAYEDCALWLSRRLKQIGCGPLLDATFLEWLNRRARDELARNLLVDAQTTKVVQALHAAGAPCVLLKGAARRATATLYPWADARRSNDVDVLVPASRVDDLWTGLRESGYELVTNPELTPAGHYHPPPLWDKSHVAVELHTSTSAEVPANEAWRRATTGGRDVMRDGVEMRVPSATELFWHGITHGLQQIEAFRLRYFLDVAVIWASGAEIDWEVIVARFASPEIADQRRARAWLAAAAWLAARPAPPALSTPYPYNVGRALRWRLAVLGRLEASSRLGRTLLEESTRIETGLGPTPAAPQAPPHARARHWLATGAARVIYRGWRAAG